VDTGDLSPLSLRKIAADLASLSQYMTSGQRRQLVADTQVFQVAEWIDARLGGQRRRGAKPSPSTRHTRRNSARVFFRILRRLDLHTGDPTLDIALPQRPGGAARPLTAAEMDLLRLACEGRGETRLPTVLALAEATVSSGEMSRVLLRNFCPEERRIWIPGTNRRQARWGYLTPWGHRVLTQRVATLRASGADEDTPLTYQGRADPESSESLQAAASIAMRELLDDAGLTGLPGVVPASMSSAMGLRVYQANGDLVLAARALGIASLDRAARTLGLDPATIVVDETKLAAIAAGAGLPPASGAATVHRPASSRRAGKGQKLRRRRPQKVVARDARVVRDAP
jgi:integrase/recombinase XerC